MALSINALPLLHPAYSDRLTLEVEGDLVQADSMYEFLVQVNGATVAQIEQQPAPDLSARLDISAIITRHLESKIHINQFIIDVVPGAVYQIDITINHKLVTGVVAETETRQFFTFNGTENEDFDFDRYVHYEFHKADWLSPWYGERKVNLTSTAYLSCFAGSFGIINQIDVEGIKVTAFQKDGTSRVATYSYNSPSNGSILQISCGVPSINKISAGLIDSDTKFYEVEEINANIRPARFTLETETKVKKTYNLLYINSLGTVDHFNFTKVDKEDISIKKDVVMQKSKRRSFNTVVEQIIDVVSDWMDENVSRSLRDLWHSPCVLLGGQTFLTDTSAPSQPRNINANTITQTSARISWYPGFDNIAVAGYNLYLDGIKVNTELITEMYNFYDLTGLTAETEYQVSLETVDTSGLISDPAMLVFSTLEVAYEALPLNVTHNIEPDFPMDRIIEINFDQPMVRWDGVELTGQNLTWALYSTLNSYDLEMTATVSADKKKITLSTLPYIDTDTILTFEMWNLRSDDVLIDQAANAFKVDFNFSGEWDDYNVTLQTITYQP